MKYIIQEKPVLGGKLPKDQKIRVIGGGIAGLLAGFYLQKRGYDFEIIEKSARTGGLLGTKQLTHGIAEQAANGFIWCPELQEVADDLALKIIGPKPSAKKRFLVRGGQLHRFPLHLGESLQMIGKGLMPHAQRLDTAEDFGNVYFGKAFTQQLLGPGLAGIYGANPRDLSFPGALARVAKVMNQSDLLPLALFKNRRLQPKIKPGKKRTIGTHSFEHGMGTLVERLTTHLEEHIRYQTDGLQFKDQEEPLLLCLPAHQSLQFFDGRLRQLLSAVQYTPLLTSTFFIRRKDLKGFKEGFGCLIPRNEGIKTLGVLFNSCIFPNRSYPDDVLSLTCILRDETPNLALLAQQNETIAKIILKDLDALFGLKGEALDYSITRWPKAVPLYSPELYRNWFEMDRLLIDEYPNRFLFGNYVGQISVRGMCQSASKLALE